MSKPRKQPRKQPQVERRTTRPTTTTRAQADVERRKQRGRENLRREVIRIGAIVLVLLVLTGIGYLIVKQTTADVDAPEIGASQHELVIGQEGAPHDVILYEDFLCPACGALESNLDGRLAELAADGKVRVSYRPFNLLGGWAEDAAAAFAVVLEKSDPEVALAFHDLLYANQPSEGGDRPSTAWLVDLAVEAGADRAAVEADITAKAGKDWVKAASDAADDAGVRSTPTVVLDGEVFKEDLPQDERADALVDAVD